MNQLRWLGFLFETYPGDKSWMASLRRASLLVTCCFILVLTVGLAGVARYLLTGLPAMPDNRVLFAFNFLLSFSQFLQLVSGYPARENQYFRLDRQASIDQQDEQVRTASRRFCFAITTHVLGLAILAIPFAMQRNTWLALMVMTLGMILSFAGFGYVLAFSTNRPRTVRMMKQHSGPAAQA